MRSSHRLHGPGGPGRLFRVIVLGGFGLVSPGACGHRKPLAGADAGVSTGQGGAGGVLGGAAGAGGVGGSVDASVSNGTGGFFLEGADASGSGGAGGFPHEGPSPCYAQPCDAAAGTGGAPAADATVDQGFFPHEAPIP